ncbi:hypothetical protein [Paenibacillus sp. 2KB_22]|uniref:hypothetical protein n=1 Tax=Paenibacillus sp. 2KB_22 TaxID=3232978 RepID=UPI003F9E73BD
MFTKILVNAFVVMMILGLVQPENLNVEQQNVQSTHITSALEPTEDKNDFETKLSYFSNPVQDPDLSPDLDPDTFRYNGMIHTEHGTFEWVEKQTIFDESKIARQLNQVNDKTEQLMIPMFGSVYLRVADDEE